MVFHYYLTKQKLLWEAPFDFGRKVQNPEIQDRGEVNLVKGGFLF